jgi:hypothetical protein
MGNSTVKGGVMEGGWSITEYGLEHEDGYAIAAEDLWESDWVSHMSGKRWVHTNDFMAALEEARIHFYGVLDFWNDVPLSYYTTYLKSERWKELREIVLKRCGHQCETCTYTKALQVHHRTYERVGHELLTDLIVLCRRCHERLHQKP